METKEYLLQRLISLKNKSPAVPVSQKVTDYIYHCLMFKKFRKYSVTSEYQKHINSAVESCVSSNEPIKISFVFGGYKLWRLEEAPEADWAELFSLIYLTNWLKPITDVYPPGVWFDFFSDDAILETMNNVPKAHTGRYIESFSKLLEFIKRYVPENLSFTLNRVGDQYVTYEEFQKDLDRSVGLQFIGYKRRGIPCAVSFFSSFIQGKHFLKNNLRKAGYVFIRQYKNYYF